MTDRPVPKAVSEMDGLTMTHHEFPDGTRAVICHAEGVPEETVAKWARSGKKQADEETSRG